MCDDEKQYKYVFLAVSEEHRSHRFYITRGVRFVHLNSKEFDFIMENGEIYVVGTWTEQGFGRSVIKIRIL